MITDAILSLFYAGAEAIVSLFPTQVSVGSVPDLSGIGQAVALGRAFDAGLPISETITLAQMYLTWLVGLFALALVIRVYKLLPFT